MGLSPARREVGAGRLEHASHFAVACVVPPGTIPAQLRPRYRSRRKVMSKLNVWISLWVALGLFVSPLPGAVRAVWGMPVAGSGLTGEPAVGRWSGGVVAAGGSGHAGRVATVAPATAATDDVLLATARRVRPATPDEVATYGGLAVASLQLKAARTRLDPLWIDEATPRVIGTTVGWVGVSFPVHGAIEGLTSHYTLWYETAGNAVVAEAEFVTLPEGVRGRVVLRGEVVIDGWLDPDPPPSGGDFWECFKWCVGASLSHDVYIILRAACNRACVPLPNIFCELCMIGLSVLEVGMISGCTHACIRNP
jgi:hypothetical protein